MRQKRLLEEARLLREARRQVWLSYGQKALLVLIACCGFAALHWLGEQKATEKKSHDGRWRANLNALRAVDEAVIQAINEQNTGAKEKDSALYCSRPDRLGQSTRPWSFDSREKLILAMQERAEVCVWAWFHTTIEMPNKELEAFSKNPTSEPKNFTYLAQLIEKEEALATVTAKVARQHVAARLIGMRATDLQAKPPPPQFAMQEEFALEKLSSALQRAAADDSSLHVFYEMLWYASLLVGVIASSILFMVLLHALPLTSGEGYWTTRIAEILKRIPSSNVIAVPLVAAAIGGGALAGSIAATEPGGQGREKPPTSIATAPSNTAIEQWFYRGGDSKTAVLNRVGGDLSFSPPLVDTRGIEKSLETISRSSEQFVIETRNARQSAAFALALSFCAMPKLSDRAEPLAAEALLRVEALTKEQKVISERVDKMADLKELIQAVQTLAMTMEKREATIDRTLQSVQAHVDRQEKVSALSLGQTAEIDPRGPFSRTFGKTKYAVGPLVPSIMDARLKDVVTDDERAAIVQLLTEIRKEPLCSPSPCSEDDFQANIEDRLDKEPRIKKQTVETFMRDHFPAMLKICALPRY
jgi:hypothetical protein